LEILALNDNIIENITVFEKVGFNGLKELCRNIMTGYYLPIEGFSNDMKELVAKMLVVDPVKRASIDTLINLI